MNALLIYPEWPDTYWSFKHALPFEGKRSLYPPLGLMTIASLFPPHWNKRLVDTNIRKLTDAACRNEVFLVSHGDFHTPDDPEFQQFPPHCVKGTPGAEFVPEALADRFVRVENRATDKLPQDLGKYQQIVLEKQTLDIFETHHAGALVERIGNAPEFVVFGVVTEYCVCCAAKGLLARKRRVAVVKDAIETLDPQVGGKTLSELQNLGARIVTTDEVLAKLAQARA